MIELENGEQYKYLGQVEYVGYSEELKDKVTKEYYKRVRKIWSSELYGNNKVIAHNIFATPVMTPIFGILNRKLMASLGCFHRNSDVDRLYSDQSKGGRGLNSLVDIFIARLVSISQHLKEQAPTNAYLAEVVKNEGCRRTC